MSFVNTRPFSRSPQQTDPCHKYQSQPTKTPQIQFLQLVEHKVQPFTTNESLKDSNKIRYPLRQAFNKPNQTFDLGYVQPNAVIRKSFQMDSASSMDDSKKNIRSISGSWNQHVQDENSMRAEPLLIKENESLRNLVANLQAQLKNYQQNRDHDHHTAGKMLLEGFQAERQEFIKQKSHQEQLFQDQQKYVEDLERKSEDLIQQNNQITTLCQDLQNEIASYKESINEFYTIAQRDLSNKSILITSLQANLDKYQKELTSAHQLQHDQDYRLRNVQVRIDTQCSQLELMGDKLKIVLEQNQQQRVKYLESERQREGIRRELVALQETNECLRRQLESARRDKEKFENENQQLLQFNQTRKDEFENLFSDLEQVQNELMDVTQQFNECQRHNTVLEEQLRKYNIEIINQRPADQLNRMSFDHSKLSHSSRPISDQ